MRVELQPGFCAWTGETGAGKSLLLGALGLLLGERGSTELLRAARRNCALPGGLSCVRRNVRREIENILDGTLDEDEIILARRLNGNGRSHAYANDRPVVIATLKQIGNLARRYSRPARDRIAAASRLSTTIARRLWPSRSRGGSMLTLAERVRELRRRRNTLSTERQQRQRELSLLRFERDELDEANLEPGEIAELGRERERLGHAQNLQAFATLASGELYDEDGSIVERLGKLQREATIVGGARSQFGRSGSPSRRSYTPRSRISPHFASSRPTLGSGPGTARRGRTSLAVPSPHGEQISPQFR